MSEIRNIEEPLESGLPTEVSLEQLLEELQSFGGIDWLAGFIEGIDQMDPARQARTDIFLNDADKQEDRAQLLQILELWDERLQEDGDIDTLCARSVSEADELQRLWTRNLKAAVTAARPLERTYRNLSLFFENAEQQRLPNLSFLNCSQEQLRDLDFPVVFDLVHEELRRNYDRIDLRSSYSMLVLPGYLGSGGVLEKWCKIAYENKVLLLTDFEDVESADDVMEMFEIAGLSGGEAYRSAAVMCCNWLVGRGKYLQLRETEDLFVPASGALAGCLYASVLSQVAAGKKFGVLKKVDGVKFQLKKSEVAVLERMHLVPIVQQYSKVMAGSAKTLFSGDNLGLQVYSVVRVFDYVIKVLMDFLNRRAFENFNANIRKELMGQIAKFLDNISGNGRLIEDFKIRRFEQDAMQKDKIHLDIYLKPYFPAKNFMIKMEGKKGEEEGSSWLTFCDQE